MKVFYVIVIVIISLALLSLIWLNYSHSPKKIASIEINGKEIKAEVAENQDDRIKGLSGRDNLAENKGMLFIFGDSDTYSIWMKEMKFPLDIIWMNNNKIVYLVESAPLPTGNNIPSFTPNEKANMVLEVNSSFIQANNVKIGDEVKISYQ